MAGAGRRHCYGAPIPGNDAGARQRPVVPSHSGCRASCPGGGAGCRSNAGHPGSARYRTVPVTVPVPVTRRVPSVREVPVTRIVPATVTVPVPVTRIVTATPPPHTPTPDATAAAPPPTASPATATAIVATPMPTPASAPVLTPTPEPQPLRSIGNRQIYAKTYGDHTPAYAENQAIAYETDANPPILAYQRFRGQSSLFIEWQQRLFTRPAPAVKHRAQNPFEESCDHNLDALVDYAREPHSYIGKERVLTNYQRREVDEIRTDITRERNPDHDTPEALIETVDLRSHRDLLIELAVTHENRAEANNPNRKFRVPPHYNSDYNRLVRSESKVQPYYGQVGSLKPALRKSDSTSGSNPDVTLTAIVKKPYQHADVAARWDVGDFRSMSMLVSDEWQRAVSH